ncbi:MAG: hypothetical protein ACREER_07195, partial [Alphaproteobacteria bacterium]
KVAEAKFDNALLNNPDDVRRLFAFDFSSSSSNVALLGFGGKTAFKSAGYTLNIGTIGQNNRNSIEVADKNATLNQATSVAATISGQFTVNGNAVTYDVTTDTLATVASKINALLISGVTASVKTGATGSYIAIASTAVAVTLGGDTGDFLAKANFQGDTTILDSANVDGAANGAANGTVSISGRTITVTDQSGAEGLKLFYSGAASTSGIALNFTVGVAADLFSDLEAFVNLTDGSIQGAIAALEGANIVAEKRIDEMDLRIELQRESLTRRFIAMEAALQSLSRIREQLDQFINLSTNSGR